MGLWEVKLHSERYHAIPLYRSYSHTNRLHVPCRDTVFLTVISEDVSFLVTFLLVTFSWLPCFFLALICLEKQYLGLFCFFLWLSLLSKFCPYSL